jgi:2-C-methyl-D-erythritol 4-phosphate cytidylyltransferase
MSPNSERASRLDVGVLIAAAGRGARAGPGVPKQFRAVGGVPMLLRAVRPFAQHTRVREIVVALPAEAIATPPGWLADVAGGRLRLVQGGATRAQSVRAALAALDRACETVLVHDAARPFVSPETIDAVITTAGTGVGALPAVAVADTLKRVNGSTGRVIETVDRTGLWRAQTPQGFPRSMLVAAFDRAGPDAWSSYTDEASLAEAAGFPVKVVPDRVTNIKLTTEDEFLIAERFAAP